MERSNFRHIYHILRKKIGLFCLALLFTGNIFGQALNKPFYDYDRLLHFGFTIGFNYSTLKYDPSPLWYSQKQVLSVSSQGSPGITLGAVADLHLGSKKSFLREHFDLRFIPSLVLTQRQFVFNMIGDSQVTKTIESAFVEFPLLLKMKSDRSGNVRFYAIGGGNFAYDLSSTAKATKNPADPKISLYPSNYSYEFGAGLDLYFPFFKFSPEIKVSQGINNVLVPDTTIYSGIFSRMRSNFIFFSMYFEG
jgi:hypothetical protein